MATVNDIAIRVRRGIDDMQKVNYSDPEIIEMINDGINFLSTELIMTKEPEMISSLTIDGQTSVARPERFVSFVGQYPIQYLTDNTGTVGLKHINPDFSGSMVVRYFSLKPVVSALTDTFPFSKLVHQTALVENVIASILPKEVAK